MNENRTRYQHERRVRWEGLKMKGYYKFLLFGIGLLSLASYQSWPRSRQANNVPLTPERLQVYGDYIEFFSKMNFKFVSNETFPLDLSGLEKDAPCLQGLQLESVEESGKMTHSLGPEVLRGRSIRFVGEREELAILKQRDADKAAHATVEASGTIGDPGVLALSEIVFDKSRHFAVLKSVFLCGSRCNSGTIRVLEKVGTRWTATTRRPCSFAINRANPRP